MIRRMIGIFVKYTTGFNPDTGIQQYLDYYQQGFRHDYPGAVKMEIVRMEIFNNENENHVKEIYRSDALTTRV